MSSERPSVRIRQHVEHRARGCCEYCFSQRRFSSDPFSVEHILPRSRGGITDPTNLALACQGCNNHKYIHVSAVDPVSGAEAPLYHPRQDIWSQHFACLPGLTTTGKSWG